MTMTTTDRPDRIANEVSGKAGRAGAKDDQIETRVAHVAMLSGRGWRCADAARR